MKPAVLTPPGVRVDAALVADPVTSTTDPLSAPFAVDAPLAVGAGRLPAGSPIFAN